MLIQCTKKLLDQLKIKDVIKKEESSLFSWHANLITLNRKKTVVLMNDNNRYVLVLYGLKAKDFKNLNEHIKQALRLALQKECFEELIIDQYVA